MVKQIVVPPLKKGEYDLVNISLIGVDPVTGRTFEECQAEWQAWLNAVERDVLSCRWWQLKRRFNNAVNIARLRVRQGM